MADTKTQEATPAAAPTQNAAPTLPSHAPVDATAVPPATVSEPKKETETVGSTAVAAAPAQVAATEVAPSTAAPTQPAKEETPEPQNPLTEKFTEAEWKALKEFRTQVADILAEAHRDKETKPTTYTIWGVTLDPSKPSAKASVVLMKFLRARNLHTPSARDMLVSTIRWREVFDVEKAIKQEYPKDIFGELGHVYGTDKGGRPVTYNLYGANKDLKTVFGDVERFIRWRVMLMEKGIEKLDFETVDQMVQVHDYEGVSMSSRDANSKRAAAEATNIFQSHYPELLYKKFFVNVPTLLTWIFWLFKPLISAATLAKMTIVGSGPHAIGKELLPVIDAKQLPKRYGGDAEAF